MSMAVFALLLVTAVGVLHWALQASRLQQRKTLAAWLAQQQMERLWRMPLPQNSSGKYEPPYEDFQWDTRVEPAAEQDFLSLRVHVSGSGGLEHWLSSERRVQLRELILRSEGRLLRVWEDEAGHHQARGPVPPAEFTLNPAGSELAYVAPHGGLSQLFRAPLDQAGQAQLLIEHPEGVREPVYSPDGSQLAFCAQEQVFVCSVGQRNCRKISSGGHHYSSLAWMPDGRGLVATRDSSFLVLLSGSQERVLVEASGGWNTSPHVAPSGDKLVFLSTRDGNPEIYCLQLPSRRLSRLTQAASYESQPRFSPDGKRIAFLSDRGDGKTRLYSMNPDGSSLSLLADGREVDEAHWVGGI